MNCKFPPLVIIWYCLDTKLLWEEGIIMSEPQNDNKNPLKQVFAVLFCSRNQEVEAKIDQAIINAQNQTNQNDNNQNNSSN